MLQQIKIIQLLPILKNIPPNLTPIHPRNKIFHAPCHKIRRIRYRLRPNPDMALLNNFRRRLHRLYHPEPSKHYWQPPARKSGYRDAIFNGGEFRGRG